MDRRSYDLMEDYAVVGKNSENNKSNSNNKNKKGESFKSTNSSSAVPVKSNVNKKTEVDQRKTTNPSSSVVPVKPKLKRKSELQTLRVSLESEKLLYDTLKHIYGSSFKLCDVSEYKNKNSQLHSKYWMERGNLVIKGVFDYSVKNPTKKTQKEITKQFAKSKLESYSFHPNHCNEALAHTDGDYGRAIEILFEKYYCVDDDKKFSNEKITNDMLLEVIEDEKLTLEAIYNEAFEEKLKNQLWCIKLRLDYLITDQNKNNDKKKLIKPVNKVNICSFFASGKKCRYGEKCKFRHEKKETTMLNDNSANKKKDSYFILEIRFPEKLKYPYEPPYIYFYKEESFIPNVQYLMIAKKLYDTSKELSKNGNPYLFEIISMLENEEEMMKYLTTAEPNFIDRNESLFMKELENEFELLPSHNIKGSTNRSNNKNITIEEIEKLDDMIYQKFKDKQTNKQYLNMKLSRRNLPAWSMMNEIIDTIDDNQVTIISGETGCGKSTQVPQFILDSWILNRTDKKEHVEIICTQPRRISAIGVAERVSAERDERIGNTVGYQIHLESKLSNWTRLTFCTIGILLQRLTSDPTLNMVTHIIVDEVHERSAESDFLLMLLRELLYKRNDLKIILMSATLKAESFSTYFNGTPIINIPGRTFPVESLYLEDIIETINFVFEEGSRYTKRVRGGLEQLEIELETADVTCLTEIEPKKNILDNNLNLSQIMGRYPKYSTLTWKNLYLMDHEKINYELIEKILEWIVDGQHNYPNEGSILIFLPGLSEISTLRELLKGNKLFSSNNGKYKIIQLHSTLTSEEQNLVFQKFGNGVRKIIISTNIAETSVTIDDCVFVIDSGRMKETRFNSIQNMSSLETCWVSRANSMQRKGRAGRVRPGVCINLFTSHRFQHHLLAEPIPEIFRISLEPLLLKIHMMYGDNIDSVSVLKNLIEPPEDQNIFDSISRLEDVGAFNSECNLTPLGHHLAALPVDVRIGKLIIYGAIFCCLDSSLTIAACLSYKSPFTTIFDKRHLIESKKKEYTTAFSDQLTTLKAYNKYIEMSQISTLAGQTFAYENYLSIKILQTLADIKHQLLDLLVSIGFVPVNTYKRKMGIDKVLEMTGFDLNANNDNLKLLQGLLCGALYPNVVKVFTPEKSFQIQATGAIPRQPRPEELSFQTKNDGFVFIHPSSVNFSVQHFPSPYIVYQEKIKTTKTFIREISMVSMLPLILFSGYGVNIEQHNGNFILSLADGWILLAVESHTVAQLLQQMKDELVKLLEKKMQEPLLNLINNQNNRKIIETIITVITRE
ncbi:putative ATP-dependent RNA helicase DHX57 isoform X2 [Aphidius gifuensis]|uniref:putative ATP-dependent RNA helicase DHX57 isoform X2 n=1 Tax=Aphidius gifuensis TaxID=684658 RepID=UPI001CDC811E|nr:putative ATP-dependent RNA helicase DHX57 isoform X2 [Aphidius gifuensis]